MENAVTKQRDFKQRVRARMEKTGERYSTARAMVLSQLFRESPGASAGGYPFAAGVRTDTGSARNMLRALGVRDRATREPLSEAMVFGLSGGVGFLYAVFEYPGHPPLLSVLTRYDTSADQFVVNGLKRLEPAFTIFETSGAGRARTVLEEELAEERPAACVVDLATILPGVAPGVLRGMAPTVVVAARQEGSGVVVDVGRAEPRRLTSEEFASARGAYKKAKNRVATLGRAGSTVDLGGVIDDAIAATLHRYEHSPYKGFASNFGFAGMEKWAKLLEDEKDPKGWGKLFGEGERACLGLRRAYQGLEYEMTGPGAGRWMYAEFLGEAARSCGHPGYARASKAYESAATAWSRASAFIASCHVPAVRTGCEMLDTYAEMLDQNAPGSPPTASDGAHTKDSSTLGRTEARAIFAQLAGLVREAIQVERQAFDVLSMARRERG